MKLDLYQGKIKKLYYTFLASSLGSALVTTVYATVDSICVGQYLGPIGSAAISCINPFWPIMIAIGLLLGVGGSVLMSNRRGAGREGEANAFFTVSIIFSLVFSVIILLLILFFKRPLIILFGAEGEVIDVAMEYMTPIAFSAPTFTLCATIATFVRADGEAVLPTLGTIVGGIVNMICDVLFIFDFGLGLGAFGAGLATAIGQAVAFLIIASYFFRRKCTLKFTFIRNFITKTVKIAVLGFSAFIIEVSTGIISVIFNNLIMHYLSGDHLAVYGTASGVLIMFNCFFYSVGGAVQPIASANYGARLLPRVKSTLKIAIITALSLGALLTAFAQLFPGTILSVFMDTTDTIMEIGPGIIRIYTAATVLTGVSIVASYYLQSILRGSLAVVLSLSRGLVFPAILAAALPIISPDAIWWAIPLAEIMTLFVSIAFIVAVNRRLFAPPTPEDV